LIRRQKNLLFRRRDYANITADSHDYPWFPRSE
jgi:hypothetical protein